MFANGADVTPEIVVVHGCCKGLRTEQVVDVESMDAALAAGASRGQVRTAYYACSLDQQVRSDGHTVLMPADCEQRPEPSAWASPHDDSDWDALIAQLLENPVSRERLSQLRAEATAGFDLPSQIAPLGPWVKDKFVEVHVYFSGAHQPMGRSVVWAAIKPAFEGLKGGDYILVAHSLGTLICADQIAANRIPAPAHFMTVGSQVGWPIFQAFGLRPFHLQGIWRNVIDPLDKSSGIFTRDATPDKAGFSADDYDNVWVKNRGDNPHDFRGYMSTAGAQESLALMLENG